jgi:hypothetical protein
MNSPSQISQLRSQETQNEPVQFNTIPVNNPFNTIFNLLPFYERPEIFKIFLRTSYSRSPEYKENLRAPKSCSPEFPITNIICCIYAYYEKDLMYKNNFNYFLQNGILNHVDYYFVINGNCSVDLSQYTNTPNITILYRENKGYDFGAYSYVLNTHINRIYDYYFFINTSVIGPCLQNNADTNWTKSFIDLFYNENVKVVGTSINMHTINNVKKNALKYGDKNVYSHVQSMFFCIKHDYLQFLKEKDFFNCDEINNLHMVKIIYLKEVGLSQIALNNGWNINCILSKYRGLNYLELNTNINSTSTSTGGDPYYPNAYFGNTINPYEVIFFKNNRFLRNPESS